MKLKLKKTVPAEPVVSSDLLGYARYAVDSTGRLFPVDTAQPSKPKKAIRDGVNETPEQLCVYSLETISQSSHVNTPGLPPDIPIVLAVVEGEEPVHQDVAGFRAKYTEVRAVAPMKTIKKKNVYSRAYAEDEELAIPFSIAAFCIFGLCLSAIIVSSLPASGWILLAAAIVFGLSYWLAWAMIGPNPKPMDLSKFSSAYPGVPAFKTKEEMIQRYRMIQDKLVTPDPTSEEFWSKPPVTL